MAVGPAQHSTDPIIGSSSPTTVTAIVLPFEARQLTVVNDGAAKAYLTLGSTSTGNSTGGWPLKAGESQTWTGVPLDRLLAASTSTSTSEQLRVGAWRY